MYWQTIQKLSYTRVKTTIYNYLGNILLSTYCLVCNASECLNKIPGIWKIEKISDVLYKNLDWELKLIFDHDKIMHEICTWNCHILSYDL